MVYTTLLYVYCYSMTMQRRGNVEEEMFLPRTLEIKFGEEYSSVYYSTIRVLLFYDDAKKRNRWRRIYMHCYSMTMMQRKSYKMLSNKKIESRIMFVV